LDCSDCDSYRLDPLLNCSPIHTEILPLTGVCVTVPNGGTDHAEKLAGLVGRRTKSGWKWLALVLNWFLYAGICCVAVIAEFTE